MLTGSAAMATTIVMPTDDQLITKSPVIVEGTVVSTAPVAKDNAIWTETILNVDRAIKGNVSGQLTIRELGGELDGRITKIFGSPEYTAGEHVLVFLTPTPRNDYQTTDLFVGKFTEDQAMNGRRLWLRDSSAANVQLLDADFLPIRARNVQRDGNGFEAYVKARAAGKASDANYGVENPLLESDVALLKPTPQLPIAANFTMISESDLYRWFSFDRGQSVRWVSYGTQPGYSGGGVSEIQTAMSVWNSVSGARISYSYTGVETDAPGGLSFPNGPNEVLFNDPKGEISGTWNPATGGVVGRGGFNGVSSSKNFTATFAADAQHTAGVHSAYEITEANLTVQDNVSPSTGISSTRLAEIVAHEFGHTLGLGHSADTTALMFPTLTGLGPSPRADDVLAVQWLYPSSSTPAPGGGGVTTAPVAPTSLSGSTSGSTMNLQWVRNSTNESGFYIYISFNNGAFSKISGSFGAGATNGVLTNAAAGNYRVYITAFNSAGESAPSNTVSLAVTAAPALNAYFTVSQSSGIAGQTVFAFTDQSTGTITSRSWSFGDGFVSTAINPTHTYNAAGQFIVSLAIGNGATSSQFSTTVFIGSASPGAPPVQADFDTSPSAPVSGSSISFTDRSTGAPTAWAWSFGDGTSSSQQNATHTYANAGTYTVSLVASNAATSSTRAKSVVVAQSKELMLNNNRYRVAINARDQRSGKTATGQATVQTSEFGYFSLPELTGDPNNPEVFVKVLGPVNNTPWVFFGGLTDVEYTLSVTDTQNNQVRTYYHAPGDAKGGYDTGGGQLPAGACVANAITDGRTSLSFANATGSQLALMSNRFALTLTARDPRTGNTASGITLAKNDESGFYTLPGLTGDGNNVEVFVKVINATALDGHYWIFFGGLTDFEYTLTVADTKSGKLRNYTKPSGSACGGFDTTNF